MLTLQAMLARTYDEDRVRAYERPRRVNPSKARATTPPTGARLAFMERFLGPLRRRASVQPTVTTPETIAAPVEQVAAPAKS